MHSPIAQPASRRTPAAARILLVDHDLHRLRDLMAILKRLPCRAIPATSGDDAVRWLAHDDAALVLVALRMSSQSGYQTAELIRAQDRSRHTPIIFVGDAADDDAALLPRAYELGGVDYLKHPLDPLTLRSKIKVFIELHEKTAELRLQKERLEAQQTYTRSLIEAITDALISTDPAGIITDVNQQAEALTGIRRGGLIGTPFEDLFTDPRMAEFGIRLALTQGHLRNYELLAQAADGRTTAVSCNATAFRDGSGALVGVVASVRDITERREIEAERADYSQRVAELSHRLVAVQEEERRRLASIVHDAISPNLAIVRLNLDVLHHRLPAALRGELDPIYDDTCGLIDDASAQMRDLSSDLRPAMLDYGGLLPAVDGYAQQFAARTGIRVEVRNAVRERLPAEIESVLFRIVQEALHNCAKHAHANHVRIELRHDADNASLTVSDDGVGFAVDREAPADRSPGLGLLTMRERAEFAGGRFEIESRPGAGTTIRVDI